MQAMKRKKYTKRGGGSESYATQKENKKRKQDGRQETVTESERHGVEWVKVRNTRGSD